MSVKPLPGRYRGELGARLSVLVGELLPKCHLRIGGLLRAAGRGGLPSLFISLAFATKRRSDPGAKIVAPPLSFAHETGTTIACPDRSPLRGEGDEMNVRKSASPSLPRNKPDPQVAQFRATARRRARQAGTSSPR